MTKLGLFFGVLGLAMVYGLYKHYEPELPSVEAIKEYKLQVPLRVYSKDGKLISVFGTKRRIPAKIEEIPLKLKQAYLAAEDSGFYSHYGFDVKGILRAVWQIVTTGKKQGGGSTITQQLTRNVFLTLDQTWTRKIKELFLAVKLERTISKDEILELYLNKIALGHRSYGVAAAAEVYYGKTLDELTLAEMAMLAAPPKAPSRINPVTSPERALQRRDYVLGRMLDLQFITQAEYDEAIKAEDEAYVHQPVVELTAPWVAEMVRTEMVARYGDDAYTDGYSVYTTIDSEKQLAAEVAVKKGLHAYDRRHGYRGAVAHHDLGEGVDLELITEKLASYPKPGGLEAALVLEIEDEWAMVRLGDGQDAELTFESSKWAVPFIDNRRVGDKPKAMSDIMSVGDVVMVKRNDEGAFELSQIPKVQGALVSLNPDDGGLYALIGGYDYFMSKFNRATQAKRQPGSGFKPIIYSGALDHGLNAASIINDAPIVFEDSSLERTWRPENYSEKFFGPTRLREGIVKSRNLVSIRVLQRMGVRNGRDHILKFGFNGDDVPANLSISLGTPNVPVIDMSKAYAVFANGGYAVEPYLIEQVFDQSGALVYQHRGVEVCETCPEVSLEAYNADVTMMAEIKADAEVGLIDHSADDIDSDDLLPELAVPETVELSDDVLAAPRAISAENQFIIESFMKDVVTRGTGVKAMALERRDLAGKTGTANEQRDTWFNGYQRQVVTNVWVGFDSPETLGRGEVGGRVALPIWIDYMRVALKDVPEWQRPLPPGIVQAPVDKTTGALVKRGSPNSVIEYFKAGELPEEQATEEQTDYDDLF
ncbi:penicillin-binding protein 1A [Marinicella rhabdoformis]|uniref:penicillin-binding protein 1A n=1 Tax=Marinicella rhabdoformis TaxID=2580566 RepID=UPI0015D06B48|nr:penicillin-binding protein 1A [Marinicella rhabdoformis]